MVGIVAKHENILPFFYGMMFSDFATTLPHKGEDCQFRKAFRNLLLSLCTPSPSLRWYACHGGKDQRAKRYRPLAVGVKGLAPCSGVQRDEKSLCKKGGGD